jgi:hypothetical protein
MTVCYSPYQIKTLFPHMKWRIMGIEGGFCLVCTEIDCTLDSLQ